MWISKEVKIGIFPKGIVHDFGEKIEGFSSFVCIKNRSRKIFTEVLEKKEAFKEYKNKCLRKAQN